jgi:hypothetical protein
MSSLSSSSSGDRHVPTQEPDTEAVPPDSEELIEVVRVRRREGRRKKAKIAKNLVMVGFLVFVFVAMCFLFSWYQSERAGY